MVGDSDFKKLTEENCSTTGDVFELIKALSISQRTKVCATNTIHGNAVEILLFILA